MVPTPPFMNDKKNGNKIKISKISVLEKLAASEQVRTAAQAAK